MYMRLRSQRLFASLNIYFELLFFFIFVFKCVIFRLKMWGFFSSLVDLLFVAFFLLPSITVLQKQMFVRSNECSHCVHTIDDVTQFLFLAFIYLYIVYIPVMKYIYLHGIFQRCSKIYVSSNAAVDYSTLIKSLVDFILICCMNIFVG